MLSLRLLALTFVAALPQQQSAPPAAAGACVALVLPAVDGVEDATAVATSVRDIFHAYLTGPSLQSIPLEARIPSQAAEEARQKACTKILTVSVSRKSSGGGGSKLGAIASAAGTTTSYMPLPNAGAAVAIEAAHAGAAAVGSVANNTRAKDEMRLTYKITTADGATILAPKTETAKAKSGGEDLLTPMIGRAAEAVAAAVTKK